ERLEWLNGRPFKKMPGSRRSLFEVTDLPALQSLPQHRYQYATWKVAKVSIDYHVEVNRCFYSVPYQLVGQRCDIRMAAGTIEILHGGGRVASHVRAHKPGTYS